MKKAILALVISFCAATMAFAQTYTDTSGHWAREIIERLALQGVATGYPDGTFRPDSPCTRAETIAMYNKFFKVEAFGKPKFSDVLPDDWHFVQIGAAIHKGYASGFADGTFRPDDNTTRLQAFCMIYKLLGSPDVANVSAIRTLADGHDIPTDNPLYTRAVSYVFSRGIVEPYKDNTLRVLNDITRAELVALLDEAGKVLEEREELKEDLVTEITPPAEAKPIYPVTLPAEAPPWRPVAEPEPAPVAPQEPASDISAQSSSYSGYYDGQAPTPTIDPNSAHGKRGWPAPAAPETRNGRVYYGDSILRTQAPATEAPAEVPATEAPAEVPATEAPAEVPATEAPVAEAPATEAPVAGAPAEEPAAEAATEPPAEEPVADASEETPVEAPVETPEETPVEEPVADAPADTAAEAPAETAADPDDQLSAEGFEKAFKARKISGDVALTEDYEIEADKTLLNGSNLVLSDNVTLDVPAGRSFEIEDGAQIRGGLGSKIRVKSGGELDIWDAGFDFAGTGVEFEIESGGTVRVDGTVLIGSNANATLALLEGTLSLKGGIYELRDAELEVNSNFVIHNGESLALLGSSLVVVKASLLFESGALISAASRDSNIIIKNGA
ncbi:MAG: S-layer homology domain-containing protein, partial [Clostridiales bacterium]|nr:S-layer homology domain-containing protein [Clostridiales bacterium]